MGMGGFSFAARSKSRFPHYAERGPAGRFLHRRDNPSPTPHPALHTPAGRPQSAASPATAPRCPERLGPGARVPSEPAPQSHGLPAPRAAPRPRRVGRARFARRDHRPSRASGLSFSWLVGSCLPPGRGRPPFVVGPPAVAASLPLTAFAPGLLSGGLSFHPPFSFLSSFWARFLTFLFLRRRPLTVHRKVHFQDFAALA